MELSLLTYNILNPYHALTYETVQGFDVLPGGYRIDNWQRRGKEVVANLSIAPFDLLFLQEVSPSTKPVLKKDFKSLLYAEHENTNPVKLHGNALAYHAGRLELVKKIVFSSAEEPRRVATGGLFHFKETSQRLLALSVHLKGYDIDERSPAARKKAKETGYLELESYLSQLERASAPGDVLLVGGDFNEDFEETALEPSRHALMLRRGFKTSRDITATEHGSGRKIDWLYARLPAEGRLAPHKPAWPFPHASDHLPLAMILAL